MKKHIILALTNPVDGREDEFNDWYDNIAYPVFKTMPGLIPLGRFKAADVPPQFEFERKNDYKYLSIYYFEADDPSEFMEKIKNSYSNYPDFGISPTIDTKCFMEPIFTSLGDVNFEPKDRYNK
ncbi:MAG: hypothetical protein KDE63_08955 [Novosphingobium sp.]|nr:hypothetical protein [Novosphingobium sp.]